MKAGLIKSRKSLLARETGHGQGKSPVVMQKAITARVACALACLLTWGCDHPMERSFFREPAGATVERLRRYELPDQYKIFRYGIDRYEPPAFELADPIAERGP